MSKLTVINHVTLDGVMQAPARPDEDRRGGFEHGGWALPYGDAVMAEFMGKGMARGGARCYRPAHVRGLRRRLAQPGGKQPDQQAPGRASEYVASTTLREPLPWVNSTLLEGDAVQFVARLKEQSDEDLAVLGSGELVWSIDAPRPRRRVRAHDPSARPGKRGAGCSRTTVVVLSCSSSNR